jgi:putative MFS transporter
MASQVVNAAGRLDRLPIRRFHWRLFALIGAGMFFDGLDSYIAGGVLGALTQSGWSSLGLNAHFISATFVGMTIGAWSAGILGDRFGRRSAYQVNLLIFGLASLAGAVAPSMPWLIAARLFMGIGIGAEVVAGYVMMGEFIPPRQRGRWVGALAVITNSALFFASVMGTVIIPWLGWRWMFGLVGAGALLAWLARRGLPESPRWLESKGRDAEAEATMAAIEAEVSRGAPLPEAARHLPRPALRAAMVDVFRGAMLMRTLVGSMIIVAISVALYGFVGWLPTFFVKQGLDLGHSLAFTAAMTLGSPLGNLFAMWLSDKGGRKLGLVACALAAAVLGVVYPFAGAGLQVVAIGFLLVFCIGVMIGTGWAVYVSELFPTELRMRGVGICNTAGRIVSIATPYAVVGLFGFGGVSAVVFTLSGILLAMALLVAAFGIETRSRSLEDLRPEEDAAPAAPALAQPPRA